MWRAPSCEPSAATRHLYIVILSVSGVVRAEVMGNVFCFFRKRRQPLSHPFGRFTRHMAEQFPQDDVDPEQSATSIFSQVSSAARRGFRWLTRKKSSDHRANVEWLYRPADSLQEQPSTPERYISFISGSGNQAKVVCLPMPLTAVPEEAPLPRHFADRSNELQSMRSGSGLSSSISGIYPSLEASASLPALPSAEVEL